MNTAEWTSLGVTLVLVPFLGVSLKYLKAMADDTADMKRALLGDEQYGIVGLVDRVDDHEHRITAIERKVA